MLGEDGEMGGSPCVDIHMNNFTIDLAGMTILSDANLTLVCDRHLIRNRTARSGARPIIQMGRTRSEFTNAPSRFTDANTDSLAGTAWEKRRSSSSFAAKVRCLRSPQA
jgi:hypothetical protein